MNKRFITHILDRDLDRLPLVWRPPDELEPGKIVSTSRHLCIEKGVTYWNLSSIASRSSSIRSYYHCLDVCCPYFSSGLV